MKTGETLVAAMYHIFKFTTVRSLSSV